MTRGIPQAKLDACLTLLHSPICGFHSMHSEEGICHGEGRPSWHGKTAAMDVKVETTLTIPNYGGVRINKVTSYLIHKYIGKTLPSTTTCSSGEGRSTSMLWEDFLTEVSNLIYKTACETSSRQPTVAENKPPHNVQVTVLLFTLYWSNPTAQYLFWTNNPRSSIPDYA